MIVFLVQFWCSVSAPACTELHVAMGSTDAATNACEWTARQIANEEVHPDRVQLKTYCKYEGYGPDYQIIYSGGKSTVRILPRNPGEGR